MAIRCRHFIVTAGKRRVSFLDINVLSLFVCLLLLPFSSFSFLFLKKDDLEQSLFPPPPDTHTHTHTHTHARTHARTYARTPPPPHTHTSKRGQTYLSTNPKRANLSMSHSFRFLTVFKSGRNPVSNNTKTPFAGHKPTQNLRVQTGRSVLGLVTHLEFMFS